MNLDPDAPVLVVAAEGWHPGVIGIVASRLRERYRTPAVIIGQIQSRALARVPVVRRPASS